VALACLGLADSRRCPHPQPRGLPCLPCCTLQVEHVVAFIGITLARAVAAPLNQHYKTVGWGDGWSSAAHANRGQLGSSSSSSLSAACAQLVHCLWCS
jgi:acyl-CoA synthetase (AMP-forming)/AMP-acid ligase II